MHCPGLLSLILPFLVYGQVRLQSTEDAMHNITTTTEFTVVTTTEAVNQTCKTARDIEGMCVVRQLCDYGTPAIDKTLYATNGYIRDCKIDKVCCPSNFIVAVKQSETPQEDFTFDDD